MADHLEYHKEHPAVRIPATTLVAFFGKPKKQSPVLPEEAKGDTQIDKNVNVKESHEQSKQAPFNAEPVDLWESPKPKL